MKRRKSLDQSRRRAQTLLALALEKIDPPAGTPPDISEIAAWAEGDLPVTRAAEVETFVARDPECYAQWRDYIDSRELLANETAATLIGASPRNILREHLSTWWRTLAKPGLILPSVAAVVVLILLTMDPSLLQDPLADSLDREYALWTEEGWPPLRKWDWSLGQVTRGEPIPDPRADPETSAFLAGLARRVEELGPWPPSIADQLRELPTEPAPCPEDRPTCGKLQRSLAQLGEWALLLQSACFSYNRTNGKIPDEKFWRRQDTLLKDMTAQFAKFDCISAYCRAVKLALATEDVGHSDPVGYCILAEELLTNAFLP